MRTVLLSGLATLLLAAPAWAAPEWTKVDAALGRVGVEQADGVRRYGFPRSDLRVVLDGVSIEPSLALGSWAAFQPMGDEVMVMGDLVLTRDNGLQPLRWIGTRRFGWRALGLNPMLRAVRICAGALGAGMPARDMIVSPNHRLLIVSDGDERLLPAYSLLGRAGISRVNASDVCYYQLMCEAHELVMVDECWSESYRATVAGLSALDGSARDQLTQILPDLSSGKDGFAPVRADVPIAM